MLRGTEKGTPCYDLGENWSPQLHVFEQLVLSWWHYFGEMVTSFCAWDLAGRSGAEEKDGRVMGYLCFCAKASAF